MKHFPSDKRNKNGLSSWCKLCIKKAIQKYRQSDKGKAAQQKYHRTLNGYLRHIYAGMNYRCNSIGNLRYKDWGGRGIKNKFESVDGFIDYVVNVLKTDPRGLQVDRIDNNGHYERGNIRFVTSKQNCNNRRKKL